MSEHIVNVRLSDHEMTLVNLFYNGNKAECVHDLFKEKIVAMFTCERCHINLEMLKDSYFDETDQYLDVLSCPKCGMGVSLPVERKPSLISCFD